MSFPFVDFLAFVFIPLSLFFIFGWIISHHLHNYGIKGDSTKNVAYFFMTVLILISLIIIIIFFSINWNSLDVRDFISKINL